MTLDPKRLDALVLGYLDAALGPEEQAALDAALRDDPEVARAVAESALLLSTLRGSAVAGRLLDETRDDASGVAGSDAVWSQLIDEALAARQRHEVEAESERLLQQDRAQAERMRLLDRRRRAMDARAAEGAAAPLVIPKWIVLASAAAVALAVVLAIAGVFDPKPKQVARDTNDTNNTPAQPDRGERPAVAFVAEVRSSVDARWGGTAHDRPTRLAAGNAVTLTQGLAEVVFDDGAAIIVQAPATFEPYGGNGMRLIAGKMTADVPPSAVGFTVQTPGGLITDYGTSFGVIVNHDGQTLAHTFSGRVGLKPADGGAEVGLGAGDVVIADTRGRVRTVEHDALAFVRQEEYAARASSGDDAYARWLAYSYELRRDPAMRLYFTMDDADRRAGELRNAASADRAGLRGLMGDAIRGWGAPRWGEGRFPGKPALVFDRRRPSAVVVPSDPSLHVGASYTLACWVRFDAEGSSHIVTRRSDAGVTLIDAIDLVGIKGLSGHEGGHRDDSIFFHTGSTEASDGRWVSYCTPPVLHAGQGWVLVAVVAEAGRVRTYLDGRLVDDRAQRALAHDLGEPLVLGASIVLTDQGMDGAIGEVALLARAMTGEEVRAMYDAGRPDAGDGRAP